MRQYSFPLFSITSIILLAVFFNLGITKIEAATITVDGIACTLTDAILATNTDADSGTCTVGGGDVTGSYGDDIILLSADITLTSAYLGENGLPIITDVGNTLTIQSNLVGTQRTITRSSGSFFRIFNIKGTEVLLEDLVIDNGYVNGLTTSNGGGLLIEASGATQADVTLDNVTVQNNTAEPDLDSGIGGEGGGFYISNSSVTINDSLIDGNSAWTGGAFNIIRGTITIDGSTIENNSAIDPYDTGSYGFGSVIYGIVSGVNIINVSLTDTVVQNNTAPGSTIYLNHANNNRTKLIVDFDRTHFLSNTGEIGIKSGTVTITDSEIRETTAQVYSGISSYTVGGLVLRDSITTIERSLIAENTNISGNVAGIFITADGSTTIINSTVSGNTAGVTGYAGIISTSGHGAVGLRSLDLEHVTIVNNESAYAGLYVAQSGGALGDTATADITNSIIAENISTGTGASNCAIAETTAGHLTLTSLDGNIIGDLDTDNPSQSCSASFTIDDMVDVADAGLEALDDNGGETETHALASDSPALDFIETDSQSEDQRGFDRPVDANNDLLEYYDAGAFESGAFEIVTEDTPCDTADCVPTLLRYACKDPSADPFLSTLFLVSTDVRYQFYSHLPLLCKFANFVFKIEPLVSDEPLDIPEIPTENLDEAFNALVTSAACPIFSEFITPHMFYNKTQRRELLLWQTFLKNRFNADVNLNGLYDSKTESAIKKFQTQFSDVVLDPWTWGPSKLDSQPTGRIYKLTQALANIFVGCGSAPQWIEDAQQSFDILAAVKSKYAEFIQAPTTSGIVVSSPVPMPKRLPRLRR